MRRQENCDVNVVHSNDVGNKKKKKVLQHLNKRETPVWRSIHAS